MAKIGGNLALLGTRKLLLLALAAVMVAGGTALSGYLLTRPSMETLYSGIDRLDASRISGALRDAGVAFDTNSDGTTIYVRFGQGSAARMLLAEKGLPFSSSGGNELFDKLGSLGLTTFMQEVTRVRALEGELARTIQLIRSVKAARVHIVMGDEGSFRKAKSPASASVVLRTDQSNDTAAASAARRLVASSVPGMLLEQVVVLGSDGTLLASNEEGADGSVSRLRQAEHNLAREIQDNIRKTLVPHLSLKNFEISVTAALNGDRRQTEETIFNPDSKVERSVRTVKETQSAQNGSQTQSTSVERNLPQDKARTPEGKSSNEENQKREELTNFELSSKRISTTSGGYSVERLSVALVVNKASLSASKAGAANNAALAAELAELEQIVASAAGLRKERGDTIKLSAVEFVDTESDIAPAASLGPAAVAAQHLGTLIMALAAIAVTFMVLFLGLRPLIRALVQPPAASPPVSLALPGSEGAPVALAVMQGSPSQLTAAAALETEVPEMLEPPRRVTQRKLEKMVNLDEELAATILRQWIQQEPA